MKLFGVALLGSLASWLTSALVTAYTGFRYNIFRDPLNLDAAVLDLAISMVPWLLVMLLFRGTLARSVAGAEK